MRSPKRANRREKNKNRRVLPTLFPSNRNAIPDFPEENNATPKSIAPTTVYAGFSVGHSIWHLPARQHDAVVAANRPVPPPTDRPPDMTAPRTHEGAQSSLSTPTD
ncbi:hypothetical protein HYFRA_00000502 [Hymenoscyphus fraxineus]|uniref:Uncharacterized protein n=1 Tax=Hymenoscyphus fraxineus TaxID=746836 RepID=A0A9N9L4W1_9HELO|nr:hypothetical protein HYFRA_00000502 [Hymenoscyphus fraxineus]